MSCPEWEILISEYLDGELSPGDAARVEQHLFECPTCAEFFRGIKADADAVAAAFNDLPRTCPVGFANRVMRALHAPVRHARRWPLVAAAVAASVAVVFVIIGSRGIGSVTRVISRTASPVTDGVEVLRGGSARGLARGAAVKDGDAIRTSADRLAFVRLREGIDLALNRGTAVAFAAESGRRVLAVSRGEVFVKVEKGHSAPAVEVRTPAGIAEVVGTQFSVAFDPEPARASVTVVEGTVRFSNAKGQRLVSGGYQSVASAGSAPSEPALVDAKLLTAWSDPPPASRIQAVAEELAGSLRARVVPAKDVFELGEPLLLTVELQNAGRAPVLFSSAVFLDREDTGSQRARYKLSQVMVTKIFGAEPGTRAAALPQPALRELKPGQSWQTSLDLSQPSDLPALRTVAGPGAYSVSIAFAAARQLPGAPDDSMVWADAASESAVVRVISSAPPVAGQAVAGLQLDLAAKTPGCRLGSDLALQFGFRGVTSDRLALSAEGSFRVAAEPVTYGALVQNAGDLELPKLLAKTLREIGIEDDAMAPRRFLELLAGRYAVNVLADRSLLNDQPATLRPDETLAANLDALCAPAGTFDAGRTAVWLMPKAEGKSIDAGRSLKGVAGEGDAWVGLRGVDRKAGEVRIETGTGAFPRPGLYRCTAEYSSRQTKTGQDWSAAWLGSVQSSSIIVAIIEPQTPEAVHSNGLSVVLRNAGGSDAARAVNLAIELQNTLDTPLTLSLDGAVTAVSRLLLYDVLNPDCYDEPDAALAKALDQPIDLDEEGVSAAELVHRLGEVIGEYPQSDALGGREIFARARQVAAGEVLEFIARSRGVSFMQSGSRRLIRRGGEALPPTLSHAIPTQRGATVTIPANGTRIINAALPLGEAGRHRIQVRVLQTGASREGQWSGEAWSEPLVVDVE